MTNKVYKSAMGKPVDLGALLLQNENVRAVGNMDVNARGDLIDGKNRVIDQKNKQVQRQYKKQTKSTNVSASAVPTSNLAVRRSTQLEQTPDETFSDLPLASTNETVASESESETQLQNKSEIKGGLAGAIARSRLIKQEQEKTLRQRSQNLSDGVKKI